MRIAQATYRTNAPRDGAVSLLAEVAETLPSSPALKTASRASLTDTQVQKLALDAGLPGLQRVAGNKFICPATKDFWKVADGKIVRMVTSEVDFGEALGAADSESEPSSLTSALEF